MHLESISRIFTRICPQLTDWAETGTALWLSDDFLSVCICHVTWLLNKNRAFCLYHRRSRYLSALSLPTGHLITEITRTSTIGKSIQGNAACQLNNRSKSGGMCVNTRQDDPIIKTENFASGKGRNIPNIPFTDWMSSDRLLRGSAEIRHLTTYAHEIVQTITIKQFCFCNFILHQCQRITPPLFSQISQTRSGSVNIDNLSQPTEYQIILLLMIIHIPHKSNKFEIMSLPKPFAIRQ
jgi:hypothetical protein